KKPCPPVWKTPLELKRGDYLTIPIAKEVRDTGVYEQEVEVGQRSTGKRLRRKLRLMTEHDLFRLIGYYLAEGYVVKRTVGFAFGEHEKEYIADSARLLEKHFGRVTRRSTIHNSTHVLLHSVLALQFFETFGRGSENKKLPDWVMFAPTEKQRELIRGTWRGDGYLHMPTRAIVQRSSSTQRFPRLSPSNCNNSSSGHESLARLHSPITLIVNQTMS